MFACFGRDESRPYSVGGNGYVGVQVEALIVTVVWALDALGGKRWAQDVLDETLSTFAVVSIDVGVGVQ